MNSLRFRRTSRALSVAALLSIPFTGCGSESTTTPAVDASADALAADASAPDTGASDTGASDTGALDAADGAQGESGADSGIESCVTLTLEFLGCDTERLAECEREYASFPPDVRAAVDADAACFRSSFAAAAAWPPDPDAAACAAPPSSTLNSRWYHGACQGQNAAVNTAIMGLVCSGTTAGCEAQSDVTCTSNCSWDAAVDQCSDIPCGEIHNACSATPGCTYAALSVCGGTGQPACFFGNSQSTLTCAFCQ
jgi:hypothetical protein